MFKRMSAILLVLAMLTAVFSVPALADMELAEEVRSDDEWINDGIVTQDGVYMMGSSFLYRWKDGETGLTRFSVNVPGLLKDFGGQKFMFNWDDAPWLMLISPVVFEDSENLTDEREQRKITAVRIDLSKEDAAPADAFDIEAEELIRDLNDDSVDVNIRTALGIGRTLYMVVSIDYSENRLYSYDKETKEYKEIAAEKVGQRLIPIDDGKILVEFDDEEQKTAWFEIYDPQTGAFTKNGGVFKYPEAESNLNSVGYDRTDNTLYYQDAEKLVAAPGLDPDAAKTVTVLSEPAQMSWVSGGVLSGKRYVYFIAHGAKIIDIDSSAGRTETFRVLDTTYNYAAVQAAEELKRQHSNVATVIDTSGKTDTEIIDALLKQDSEADIYILNVDSQAYNAMYERGYLPEITNPEVVSAVANMYPAFQEVLMKDGKTVAIPVELFGETIGMNEETMKALGIGHEELPHDWQELLKKLPEWSEKLKDQDKMILFEVGTTVSMARQTLLDRLIDTCMYDMHKNGVKKFDTPEMRSALQTVLDMDFKAMGVPDDMQDEDDRDRQIDPDAVSLIAEHSVTSCGGYNTKSMPLAMTVIPGGKPYMPVNLNVAVINPYSRHPELAQEYLAMLLSRVGEITAYSVSPEKNEPVLDRLMEQSLADTREQISALEKNLEKATGTEKNALEERLKGLKMNETAYNMLQWRISKESIDWYRAHTDDLYVQRYKYINFNDISDLESKLVSNEITIDRFIKEFEDKLSMSKAEDAV